MRLYFKIQLFVLILICPFFLKANLFNSAFLETNNYDNYNVNFLSSLNKLNPKHWLILLSNGKYEKLNDTLFNAMILSKDQNKILANYFFIKNINNLSIQEQNKLIKLLQNNDLNAR